MLSNLSHMQTFEALSNHLYRRLWLIACVYYMVRVMEMVVTAWLVLDMTNGSALMVAIVGALRMLPMIFGPIAGILSDRFKKQVIILLPQVTNFIVNSAIAILITLQLLELWHVFLATLIIGLANATDFAARRSFFSEVLKEHHLVNGLALDGAAHMGALLAGPALGGLLITLIGFQGTYTAMLAAYIFTISLLLSVSLNKTTPTRILPRSSIPKININLAIFRNNRLLRHVLAVTVVFNCFGAPCFQMVPVVAQNILGVGATMYGILFAALGLGAIVGSLTIATIRFQKHSSMLLGGTAIFGAGMFLVAMSTIYPLSFVLLLIAGIGMSAFNIMQTTLVLTSSPPEERGRAMGAVSLGIGISPIGIVLIGQLSELLGPQIAIAFMSGISVILIVILRFVFGVLRDNPKF